VSGSDTSSRPAVSFGEGSEVRAILVAPHGTVAMADHVHATGACATFDIQLGEEVEVDIDRVCFKILCSGRSRFDRTP
jgi:hypothetical protein